MSETANPASAPDSSPVPAAPLEVQPPVDALNQDQLTLQVDVWKTMVGVQEHFNDIGWRIRSLAITALTFTLGATFFGYLNADPATLGHFTVNPAALVPLLGIAIWLLFWFADGVWYHRLLSGAGRAAGPVEKLLKRNGVDANLSTSITEASHKKWMGIKSNSTRKVNTFYILGIIILLLTAGSVVWLSGDWAAQPHPPVPSLSPSRTP